MATQKTLAQCQVFQKEVMTIYESIFTVKKIKITFKDLLLYLLKEGKENIPVVVSLLFGTEEIPSKSWSRFSLPKMDIFFKVKNVKYFSFIAARIIYWLSLCDNPDLIKEIIEKSFYVSEAMQGTLAFEIFPGEFLCIPAAIGQKILELYGEYLAKKGELKDRRIMEKKAVI